MLGLWWSCPYGTRGYSAGIPARPTARRPCRGARRLCKLASARQRARIITGSWDGASVAELAQRLGCHLKTIYKWLHRFNDAHGIDGPAHLPRPGVLRRLTEHQRGRLVLQPFP